MVSIISNIILSKIAFYKSNETSLEARTSLAVQKDCPETTLNVAKPLNRKIRLTTGCKSLSPRGVSDPVQGSRFVRFSRAYQRFRRHLPPVVITRHRRCPKSSEFIIPAVSYEICTVLLALHRERGHSFNNALRVPKKDHRLKDVRLFFGPMPPDSGQDTMSAGHITVKGH